MTNNVSFPSGKRTRVCNDLAANRAGLAGNQLWLANRYERGDHLVSMENPK